MHQAFARARLWLLLPTIVLFIIIAYIGMQKYPAEIELQSGFLSPIVAFELGTINEIRQLLGDPATGYGKTIRNAFDSINMVDYAFLVFYTLTFIAVFATAAPTRRMFFIAVAIALTAMVADMVENIYMLSLTASEPDSTKFIASYEGLSIATRIKWGLLFTGSLLASFLILVKISVARKMLHVLFRMAISILFFCTAALGFLAIGFESLRYLADPAGLCFGIGMILGSVDKPVLRTG